MVVIDFLEYGKGRIRGMNYGRGMHVTLVVVHGYNFPLRRSFIFFLCCCLKACVDSVARMSH